MSQSQSKYTSKLVGKTVLIIGGTSGLGFGLAEACVENSVARLVLSSSQQPKIDWAIERLKTAYPNATTSIKGYACDLGTEATLESNIRKLFSQIQTKIDHIMFTAGDVLTALPISNVDLPALKQAGMVRFFAPFFVAKHGISLMQPGPASSITLTTGAAGDRPLPGMPAVSAYSAGLAGLTRSLALDLRPVRVNVVCPSVVDTELWNTVMGPNSKEQRPPYSIITRPSWQLVKLARSRTWSRAIYT